MSSRLTIFDKTGVRVAELDATFKRSWRLNEYGIGSFSVSTQDTKAIIDHLQFGNYIFSEHDKLPSWAGMIDTPRTWGEGRINCSAYSGEYLMTMRITPRTLNLSGSYGMIYDSLIKSRPHRLVRSGDIYGGGPVVSMTYNYADVYAEIKKLAQDSGNDFSFEPEIDSNGGLVFAAHWYEKRGMERAFVLYEDRHLRLSSIALREQGEIRNRLRVYGEGATFDTRPVSRMEDDVSADKYGARWKAIYAGPFSGQELESIARKKLIEYAEPRKTFDLTVLDEGNAFHNCRIGDTQPVEFYTVGFTGASLGMSTKVRVLQMEYDEENNILRVVSDEAVT